MAWSLLLQSVSLTLTRNPAKEIPMKPRFSILLLVLALLTVALFPIQAEICGLDRKPAATLLLPYFEVDLSAPDDLTTLFSINNADRDGVIAQVTIWSDLGIPVTVFQMYMAGYGGVTVNMRDVLNGAIPVTNPPNGSYPGCPDTLPQQVVGQPPLVPFLKQALSGQPVVLQQGESDVYYSLDEQNNLARGFLTIDVANVCTSQFPGDIGYFADGGTGSASNRNVLWGDYFYVEAAQNLAQGFTLVSLEADASDARTSTGSYTHYARFSGGEDNREPLPTTHMVRFIANPEFNGQTVLYYWRDSKLRTSPLSEGELPDWYPLDQTEIVAFDDQDNAAVISAVLPFPAVSGKVRAGGGDLPLPFASGRLYLNLNTSTGGLPVYEDISQSVIATAFQAFGEFSVGVEATELDSTCDPLAGLLPLPGNP
jgi:hypothetical protein